MARGMALLPPTRTLLRWHVWLGWLVGVPIIMWLATGLLMVSRPIEQVRGEHLRREAAAAPLVIDGSADSSQPLLIMFTALSLVGAVIGGALMFRRRKPRPEP